MICCTKSEAFRPVTAGLCLINSAKRLYPEAFAYIKSKRYPDVFYIDLLVGNARVRQALEGGVDVPELIEEGHDELAGFQRAADYLYE